jgi:hypothetical protein
VSDFDTFWAAYPRRVGKFDAVKAYANARTVATAAEILAGVETYKQHKPEYCDYAHPSSWLNKGRWMDEYDEPEAKPAFEPCAHTPTCPSPQWCLVRRARDRGEVA